MKLPIFTDSYDIDDICTELKKSFETQKKRADNAISEMRKLRNEKWKDNELLEMKDNLDKMREDYLRGYPISEEEEDKISKWKDQHWTNKHNAPTLESRLKKIGAIGGSFTYEFNPTSIGTFGTIYCNSCMAKARRQAYKDLFDAEASGQKFNYNNRLRELIKEYDAEFAFQDL